MAAIFGSGAYGAISGHSASRCAKLSGPRSARRQGGLAAIEKQNIAKANLLYDYLDASSFYANPVRKEDRSRMNVPFTLKDAALDEEFLKGAKAKGMAQLKGHRSVGGMRASIYNAMPVAGVAALVAYMKEFEARFAK